MNWARAFFLSTCILLVAWVLGLHVASVARVVFPLSVLLLALVPRFRSNCAITLEGCKNWHLCLIAVSLGLLAALQYAQVRLGMQGIDFAIFTDVIRNFALDASFNTVLVGEGTNSFLSHHFSPILAVPGVVASMGVAPALAGIVVHILGVVLAFAGLWLLGKALGINSGLLALALLVLCLNPSMRVGLSWEIHDETFALAFVVCAYFAFFSARHKLAATSLVLAMLCKETFFVFAVLFAAMACLWEYLWGKRSWRTMWPYLPVCLLALLGLALYVIWPLPLFGKTFDPIGRVSTISELLAWGAIKEKAGLIWRLLLPFLFLPLWTRKGVVAAIPAGAFLGPILLSNFANMYFPYNYYSVLPTLVLFIASLVSLAELGAPNWQRFPALGYLALVSLSLTMAGHSRPLKVVLSLRKKPLFSAQQLAFVPRDATVLVQDYDVQYVLGVKKIYRAWTAERISVPWTHLVQRKTSQEPWAPAFLDASTPCAENEYWVLRCRRPLPQ